MEIKNLNLIPEGDKPVIHASQFDENRSVRFNLKDGEEEYTLESGITLECHIKKVDGNVVTFAVTNTETKYIDVYFPQQATACAGPNVGEIVIIDEDEFIIGTINFILEVKKSPMLGGIESASAIHDLTEQIETITAQIIGNDYYNKTEVDALLDQKADISDIPDMSDYYDKSEVDNLLDEKADISDLPDMSNYYNKTQVDNKLDQKANISDLPDMTDYYTKTATDNLLANKADISDLPDMSNYYTKTEVDNKFLDIMPVNTVSDSIANFTTLIVAPLEGLKTYITAQGGGGTPTTPIAIVGWDSVNVTCADEDMQTVDTFTLNLGQTIYGGYVDWENGKMYATYKRVLLSDLSWSRYASTPPVFYARVDDKENTNDNYVIAEGFESINDTAANVAGAASKLTSNYTIIASKGSTNPNIYLRYDEITSAANLPQALENLYCVYELATPIEIGILLTIPTMPSTIEGFQNWFADSGDIDISFKQDIQNYVDSKISAANVNRTLSMIRPATIEENTDEGSER